jgi:hypothetical protein
MKRNILLTLVLAMAGVSFMMAQTTALVVYEGGYFVKDGKEWTEYRPADKVEPWNEYIQYKEDDKFFYLKSKRCNVSVPKISHDKIYVDRKKNGNWEVVYNTIDVHHQCVDKDGLFYCYQDGRGREHNGYYVRLDNGVWHEYAPGKKRGVWAEFKQTGEDKDYFIVESKHNIVKIPKKPSLNFVITQPGNSSWRGGYTTKAIYDRSAAYMYNFCFENYAAGKNDDYRKGARISLDNKCNIQVAFGGKHYDFVYTNIELVGSNGKEAVLVTINKDNRVWLYDGSAKIECKSIGKGMKGMLFLGVRGNEYRKIAEQLKVGTFRL